MHNWNRKPEMWLPSSDEQPERPLRWTLFDYALILAAFLVLVVIGLHFS